MNRITFTQIAKFILFVSFISNTLSAPDHINVCSWTCENECATCLSKENVSGGFNLEIDLSGCKNDTISWACCKNVGCYVETCDGVFDDTKCDELTTATFFVPDTETSLIIEIHDGRLSGNVNCYGGECCGGDGTSCDNGISGVCRQTINLSTCEYFEPECTLNEHCVSPGDCGYSECIDGACENSYLHNETLCRSSAGDCDEEEYCSGYSYDCPEDSFLPSTFECRPSEGDCDISEYCSGYNATCPYDVIKDSGTLCRTSNDFCDVEDFCDGISTICQDQRNDYSYSFKCGTTCFLCGIKQNEIGKASPVSYKVDDCGIGRCDTFVELNWPNCIDECIETICPNNKALSNAGFYTCQADTNDWMCNWKVDTGDYISSVCPRW